MLPLQVVKSLVSVVNPYTLCDQIALDCQHRTIVVTGELLSLVCEYEAQMQRGNVR